MTVVAVIPARGGSKGIPRKNLQLIDGVPLVGWSIRAALAAKNIDAVYVSTEDTEIAKVANSYGAKDILRPTELAADTALTHPVLQHAAKEIGLGDDDVLVCLECTSPFHMPADIDCVIAGLTDSDDISMSVCRDHAYQLRTTPGGIEWLTYDRSHGDARRQELPLTFRLGGGISALHVKYLLTAKGSFDGRAAPVEIPEERCIDIDTPFDLYIAREMADYGVSTIHWIVIGSSPGAQRGRDMAHRLHPQAHTITTNRGEQLFQGSNYPTVYHLHDSAACEIHQDVAKRFAELGSRLTTIKKADSALKRRGVDWFDEFMELSNAHDHPGSFVPGQYCSCGLSGLMCLQYALNDGATDVHLVGMEGYGDSGHYFDGSDDCGHEKNKRFTKNLIQPFVQSCIDACPDVTFHFYGKIEYEVMGDNVRWLGQ